MNLPFKAGRDSARIKAGEALERFPACPEAARNAVRAELYYMDCTPGLAGSHGREQPRRRK